MARDDAEADGVKEGEGDEGTSWVNAIDRLTVVIVKDDESSDMGVGCQIEGVAKDDWVAIIPD